MERITNFEPAYDKRSEGYGVHGVDLRMFLKGELGVVQFIVYTNWHLPHIKKERVNKTKDKLDIECFFIPMPADIGYHSPKPIYEGQYMTEECQHLDGKPCYYDGSGLYANEVFDILVEKGSDAVWEELESYYIRIFGELK